MNIAKRHVSPCYYWRWVGILDACEAGCSTLLLSAAPAVVNSTSLDLRQCQNANSRPHCQPRGLLQQYLIPGRCRTPLPSTVGDERRSAPIVVKWDSITSTLRDTLHWLLVRQRTDFMICLLVYKCLHQRAAPYLESMVTPVSAVTLSTRRHLRSAGQDDLVLVVPRTGTVGFGPRSFSVASCWSITVEYFTVTRNCLLKLLHRFVASWRQWCSSAVSTHERSRHNFDC